jgi:CheY-like chemotaxis protein
LFPVIESPAPVSAAESGPAKPWRGTGTVLVVDDEEIVRNLAKKMVEIAGFSVLTANDGEEAVRLYREHQNEIACVLLDLTMPKMGGEEAFRAIRQISPDVRVILSSGYSEETATGRFAGMGLAGFIQKPYQLDTMIATLREAVGGGDEAKIHPL